jgi:predicted enzyme related to lactoylglutathione lyase
MNRPIHFEIPADNTDRAIAFYSKAFGWEFSKWDGPMPYWMIKTGADACGIDGGMMNRMSPQQGVANTIGVADLDATVKTVVDAGGTVTVPKMAIPGVGWLAYALDTEGNTFGMMQNDSAAA